MKIGSLFSGAGGLDMAVEQVFGGTTIWHVENDPAASKVLAKRWPTVPNYGDITTIDWRQVHPVDVLCGGWPCQPFSHAGKKLGADDERALWPHVAGAVRLLRPGWVVLENVSAVLTAGAGEFQRVADDLAEAGYEFCWVCVRASDVGAPHRRERVFILAADTARCGRDSRFAGTPIFGATSRWIFRTVGVSADGAGPVNLLPTPRVCTGDNNASGHRRNSPGIEAVAYHFPDLLPTPRSSDQFGAGLHGDGGPDLRTTVTNLLPTPCADDGASGGMSADSDMHTRHGNSHRRAIEKLRDASKTLTVQWGKYEPAIRRWESIVGPAPAPTEPNRNGDNKHDLPAALLPTPTASDSSGGGQNPNSPGRQGHTQQLVDHALLPLSQWGKYALAIRRWETLTRPAPNPTEPNRNGNPRLNPAFSEWMMGWPDGWVTNTPHISRKDALRIIGNGVVPQQACAALTYLLSVCGVAA